MKKVIKGLVLCIISVMLFSHFATLKKPNAQNSNENIEEFEKTEDLDEWYAWFDSLSPENQKKVNYRPAGFYERQQEESKELTENLVDMSELAQDFDSVPVADTEIIGGQNLPLNTPTPKPTVTPKPTLTPTPVSVKGIVTGDYNTTYGDIEEYYNKCIEEFEKTVDLDEWYAWFDSLSPENQKKS